MKFRDRERLVRRRRIHCRPHGVEHCPVAAKSPRYPDRTEIDVEHRKHHQRKDGRPARAHPESRIAPAAIYDQPWNTAFTHSIVFTNNRFEGNPLAVLPTADGLSDDQMLAICRAK